jgi:Protein of unknown function (DUF1585)
VGDQTAPARSRNRIIDSTESRIILSAVRICPHSVSLNKRHREIARNFAEQLIVYNTGTPILFADRDGVDGIPDKSSQLKYGVWSILPAVIQSELFRNQ